MLEIFPRPTAPDFLSGGGEMGERIRAHDWTSTPLGPAGEWPQGLATAARMMLASRQPMSIWWGPELVTLYNDACRALIGGNHPAALGQPVPCAWREIWDDVGARVEGAIRGGGDGASQVVPLLIERRGRIEEAHFTIAFTAMPGGSGVAGGVMCSFTEITRSVVGDRQLALLKEVANRAAGAETVEAACALAAESLSSSAADIPFAAIYLVDARGRKAKLAAASGIAHGPSALPDEVTLSIDSPWPFAEVTAHDRRPFEPVMLPESLLGTLPAGSWRRGPREAALVCLGRAGVDGRRAVLLAAFSPFLAADDNARFIELVAAQVAAGIANAHARNEESRRLEVETLHEVARDIASELDLQQVVQKVTDAGTQLTGARFGAFFYNVTDSEGNAYQLYTLSGAPRAAFEKFGMPRATPVFKPTFLGQGPVRSEDITRDARYGQTGPHHGMPSGHLPVKSYLAVPVIARNGEVIGGLFFGHPEPGRFDERAERNALGLAAQAAIAIDNASLFGRAKQEIDRRTQMEGDLRKSERRLRELVAGLPAAVYTTDARGHIEHFNAAAAELWGRAPEAGKERYCGAAALYTPAGARVPHEDHPLAEVLRGSPVPHHVEVVVERPDGTQRHAVSHPRPIRDESGRVVGAVNMVVDITEHKAAQAELAFIKDQLSQQVEGLTKLHQLAMELGGIAELEPALAKILETAVEAQGADRGLVWLHDEASDRLVVQASRGFDAVGRALFHDIPIGALGGSAGHAFAHRRRWSVADTESDPLFEPFRAAARAAGFRAVHSTPIVTRAGALLGVLSVHYVEPHPPLQREMQIADVCSRHAADAIEASRAQQAQKRVENELRELDQRKDEFLATLAHELRNPLAPLRNGLEVMRVAAGSPETVAKARAMMERQLAQMVRLVDDLLDVSRVSRGRIELRRGDVELAAVLRNALETSQPLMSERGQQLDADVPSAGIVIHGDLTRLSQVFCNLLNNAAKYTERAGRIALSVRLLEGRVAVSVKDNGIGIPPHMLGRVFDIFTQADRALEKSQGGLGIGLSIAKRLVEMHGGTIEARSAGHGLGSEFVVELPARFDSMPAANDPGDSGPARGGGVHRRILVADDNEDSAATLSILLEAMGNEVRTAHDGLEALQAAASLHPDVILLDIGMPRMNGYEVCARLRREPWGTRAFIVALTGWGQAEDKSRSRDAGFDRHLVKPVEPLLLEQMIRELPIAW